MDLGIIKVLKNSARQEWLVLFRFREGVLALLFDEQGNVTVPMNAFFRWDEIVGGEVTA